MVDYQKEPSVRIEPADPQDARTFLGVMIAVVILVATLIIVSSVLSNHYGYFGDTGQFEFYNGRKAKVEYLMNLPAEELPDAWIMGSSNMMPFQTHLVESLFGVKRAFNLGSYWGRTEDLWAWSNFVIRDLNSKPKLVIMGVEPWTFSDDQRGPPLLSKYRRRLLATDELAQYLPEHSIPRRYASIILDSLTFQSIRLMLRMSIKHHMTHVAQPAIDFDPEKDISQEKLMATRSPFALDGTSRGLSGRNPKPFLPGNINTTYSSIVPDMVVPDDILSLDKTRQEAVKSSNIRLDEVVNFLPGDRTDPTDMALFYNTLELLRDHHVEVIIIMLPMHPYFFDLLVTHTKHAQHLENLRSELSLMAVRFPNIRIIYDASHIARFGGDPNAFHDRYHMTPDNTDRVLNQVASQSGGKE